MLTRVEGRKVSRLTSLRGLLVDGPGASTRVTPLPTSHVQAPHQPMGPPAIHRQLHPIHMARMRLIVEMDLAILENRIAFSNVRVTFDCDANTQSLPVWMCNPIFDFQERLREAVRSSVRAAFEEEETAAALANGFERGMESVLGANARVATVHMENGLLCLGLIRPVRAAVA